VLSENTFNNVVGTLVAYNAGYIYNCYATGQIRSDFRMTGGGLASSLLRCRSDGSLTGDPT